MPMTEATFERLFGIGARLNAMSNIQWYVTEGWKNDIGFQRLPGRTVRVACVICGRAGPGSFGTYQELRGFSLNGWQAACMKPHTDLCACGKAYPTPHALAMHVQANRRHRIEGHGRMDRVGY